MLPTPTESHTGQGPASPPAPPTPRAQFARVVVALGGAVLLGAGPAVAWDLTTQPPRAEARSGWPRPSPWLAAGKQMKAAVGGIARVYLPRDLGKPADPADPSSASATPSVTAPSVPPPPASPPVVISVPTPYPRPYRLPLR